MPIGSAHAGEQAPSGLGLGPVSAIREGFVRDRLTVLCDVLEVEGAEGFADVAFTGMEGVADEGGELEDVDLGPADMAGGGLGGGDGFEQAPQEADVEATDRRADGTVVQLLRGERLQLCSVDWHGGTLP